MVTLWTIKQQTGRNSKRTYDNSILCLRFKKRTCYAGGTCSSVDGWGTMLQAGRSPVRVPDEVDFFKLPNPSSCTMALGSTQPLTEMSTRNLPGVKSCRCTGQTTLPPSTSQMPENVGASTSYNPKGPDGLYRENFTFSSMLTLSKVTVAYFLKIHRLSHIYFLIKQYGWNNYHNVKFHR
jgi:hypothetical protein